MTAIYDFLSAGSAVTLHRALQRRRSITDAVYNIALYGALTIASEYFDHSTSARHAVVFLYCWSLLLPSCARANHTSTSNQKSESRSGIEHIQINRVKSERKELAHGSSHAADRPGPGAVANGFTALDEAVGLGL